MGSLLQSTQNTRALPSGDFRYIRSDYPGNLTTSEVQWLLQNNIVTIIDSACPMGSFFFSTNT